jgi:lysyl-tRNA synthetase class 2
MFDFNNIQLKKLTTLRDMGVNPYPNSLPKPQDLGELISQANELPLLNLPSHAEFIITGRLRFKNAMGKLGFGRIESEGHKIQFCVRRNILGDDQFKIWKKLDLGDWVWLKAGLMRTRTGELTLDVKEIRLYAKCIEGMPDKAAGVTDQEVRQRQRYLDLIVNEESRRTFRTRFEIVKYIRRFLEDEGFVEVETPTLQSIPGGASAKPFTTHHNALDTDLYMRVAPELYLKRLIVGGFERVFEIGKNFRNEGVSTKHNPEFTMVEFYQAHATYLDLMKLTQNLITDLAFQISGDYGYGKLPYGDLTIDFAKWERISYGDALMKVGVEDPWSIESLRQFIVRFDSDFNLSLGVGDLQQLIFDRWIEPQLINPTFITHYPTSFSPLARRNDDDPRVTDRFELFIAGSEIANGFSELNDPVDQAERFAIQAQMKADGDDEAMFFDEDYIRALSYGMPPTAGEGIGIDRLVMLLTNSQSIRDVILFPTMKSR